MNPTNGNETVIKKKPEKVPVKNTVIGCLLLFGLIVGGIGLFAFFAVGPQIIKEYFFNTEDALAFSTQYNVSVLVMIFIIFWVFPCIYWVKGVKHFLLAMTVPTIAWLLLFFNYHLVTYEGVRASPYFQVVPEFIKWEDMEEVAFIPEYRVGRRDTTFEISIAYLDEGKSHWIDTNNDLEKLQKLKDLLAKQGDVPVFIYPLDKGDISRLDEIKKDSIKYYEEILKFLEVKDLKHYKREHILVNESFY